MAQFSGTDEILAKRLQNEEYRTLTQPKPNLQQLQDEDLARQIARDEHSASGTQFQLSSGQSAMVRLHHPATALQIGEILLAHFVSIDEMVFEMAQVPDKYLKINGSGNVEFSLGRNSESIFKVSNSPSKALYLMPKAFLSNFNCRNTRGWYLTMTPQGQLLGNGDKGPLAEWQLVSAASQLNGLHESTPATIPSSAILQEYNNPLLCDSGSESGQSQNSKNTSQRQQKAITPAANTAGYLQLPNSSSSHSSSNKDAKILRGELIPASIPPAVSSSPPAAAASLPGSSTTALPNRNRPQYDDFSTANTFVNNNRNSSNISGNNSNVGLSMETPSFPGYGAGREALMKYFFTEEGFLFLQSAETSDALQLFLRAGILSNILHRPDWPIVAHRFRAYASESIPSLLPENIHSFKQPTQFLIFQQFFTAGYTVVRQVVSPSLLQAANKIIQFWMYKYMQQAPPALASSMPNNNSNHNSVSLGHNSQNSHTSNALPINQNGLMKTRYGGMYCVGDICQDVDILALYYDSGLPQLTQYLLGNNDVLHPKRAHIRSSFPTLDVSCDSPALYGDQWTIEGFTAHGDHSPYSLFLGIALTDISEADMGNLCVHPESHMLLMDLYKDHVLYNRTLFSEDPQTTSASRPNLGQPLQICLKAGDAFLCTQRLATLFTINTSFSTTTMVFFRLSHVDHAQLKAAALDSPWIEFPLASYYLDPEDTQTKNNASDVHNVFPDTAVSATPVSSTLPADNKPMSAVAAPIDTFSGRPIVAEAFTDPFAGLGTTTNDNSFDTSHFPIEWSSSPGHVVNANFTQPLAGMQSSGNDSVASSLDLLWTDITPTTPFSPSLSTNSTQNNFASSTASGAVPSLTTSATASDSTINETANVRIRSPTTSLSSKINPINHTVAFSPSQSSSTLLFFPSQQHQQQQPQQQVEPTNSTVAIPSTAGLSFLDIQDSPSSQPSSLGNKRAESLLTASLNASK